MFVALSLSSLALSSALSHHKESSHTISHKESSSHSSSLSGSLSHQAPHIAKKLELEAIREKNDHFTHSHTTESQVLFTDILSEIAHIKSVHGKMISPHVLERLEAEGAEDTLSNLRGNRSLMKKNNFIELSVHSDMECMNKIRSVGRLVNYCYNQYDGSYLFKVNRKENIIAQIEYAEQDCVGIPDKVTDLQYVTHTGTAQFSDCVNGVKWSYLSEYPVFSSSSAGYGSTYSNEEVCDGSKKNYYGYDFRAAESCVKIARQNGVYSKADVKGCDSTNAVTSNYYFDKTCSGTIAYSTSTVAGVCEYPSWWDGDDQDDFKQDGSNYVVGEVHTDYCFDPTHSTDPSPPVTGTCETSFFNWAGDGFCDSSLNNAGCNYDSGDCCKETCVSTVYECGKSVPFNCINPAYA